MKDRFSNFKWIAFSVIVPFICSCGPNNDIKPITNYKDLVVAITQANNGDVIYVDDIDFRGEEQLAKSIFRINVSNSITIKGVHENKKARFLSGSFNLSGTKVAGEKASINFENICFDGDIEGSYLNDYSWYLDDPNDAEPKLCQYAMLYKGNIDASYNNCEFKNYMYPNGGALVALYDDYLGNESILLKYGDNSQCKLSINISNCTFNDNYSYYGGGAIYLESNKENISLNINNSTFTSNKSSCMEFARGGGAIFAGNSNVEIKNSYFKDNNGSYSYGFTKKDVADVSDVPPEFIEEYLESINDQTSGGAISVEGGKCNVINSNFIENNASLGGALGVNNTKLLIDGCVFNKNTANCDLLKDPSASTGPWSMMGLGGAIYINSCGGVINELWNNSFYENVARNGYGSIYSFYNGDKDGGLLVYPDVKVNFCSFKDNTETISYDKSLKEWSARPGNLYDIPYIKFNACLVDDVISCDYFGKYELPTLENNYCYFTNESHSITDKVETIVNEQTNQLTAISKGNISLNVPNEFSKKISSGHYKNNEPSSYHIGSNYSLSLYREPKQNSNNKALVVTLIVIASLVVISACVTMFILLKNKKAQVKEIEIVETPSKQSIDEIISNIDKEYKLTSREKDVLKQLLQGKRRSEIAKDLFLSESAIKKYTSSIYSKIGVHSKLELIMKYQNK